MPNVTVRVFLLHEVEKLQLRDSLLRFIEATKLLTSGPDQVRAQMLPYCMYVCMYEGMNSMHLPMCVYQCMRSSRVCFFNV